MLRTRFQFKRTLSVNISKNNSLKSRVVSHALKAVICNNRVLTNSGYRHLYDLHLAKDEDRLYFKNGIGISDCVFLEHGLKPIPKDKELDVNKGDVIVYFSYFDIEDNQVDNIQFAYVFGGHGAQGFEIRIYRSLLFWYFLYVYIWQS